MEKNIKPHVDFITYRIRKIISITPIMSYNVIYYQMKKCYNENYQIYKDFEKLLTLTLW